MSGEVGCMRPSKAHRYTKSLGTSEHNVCAKFSRRFEHHETQKVRSHRDQSSRLLPTAVPFPDFTDLAGAGGILEEDSKNLRLQVFGWISRNQFDSHRFGTCFEHIQGLRMNVIGHKKSITLAA